MRSMWLVLPVVLASPAALGQLTITFEELGPQPSLFSNTTPLRNQIPGASFSGPGPLDGGAIVPIAGNWGVNAHSGEHFLGFNLNATMMNGGVPRDPETITLAQPVGEVSIWASGGFNTDSFTMEAYDAGGILLGSAQVATRDWAQLRIVAPGIARIRLTASSADGAWIYDDLVAGASCYPDCDGNGGLNVNDYICFQTKFALGDPYADCDGNGVRNVNDYICFQTKFALGC